MTGNVLIHIVILEIITKGRSATILNPHLQKKKKSTLLLWTKIFVQDVSKLLKANFARVDFPVCLSTVWVAVLAVGLVLNLMRVVEVDHQWMWGNPLMNGEGVCLYFFRSSLSCSMAPRSAPEIQTGFKRNFMLCCSTPTFSTNFSPHIRCVCVNWPALHSMSFHWRHWQPYIELHSTAGSVSNSSTGTLIWFSD